MTTYCTVYRISLLANGGWDRSTGSGMLTPPRHLTPPLVYSGFEFAMHLSLYFLGVGGWGGLRDCLWLLSLPFYPYKDKQYEKFEN